jgi:glycosyltransferase involved in cell wall biosynthesis
VRVEVAKLPAVARLVPRSWALLLGVGALRRALRRIAPDILVSAGNHGHPSATFASLGLPLRRVVRISNELEHPDSGALSRRARSFIHRWLVARADRLLLVSAHLACHPLLARAVEQGKAVVTPNGVDIERVRALAAAPCPHRWLEGPVPVVMAVGRLAQHKNLDTLLRAVARAARTRPLRLMLVGGGPASVRAELEELASQLGMREAFHVHGEVANPFAFIARASVLALPSLWEGASNVLLEALACGTPVVAARSAGNAPQVLDHGRHGLLVDAHDVDGMARAILDQAGPVVCPPGLRANDYAIDSALERVCAAICDARLPPAPAMEPIEACSPR